jgi:hypothetical protein
VDQAPVVQRAKARLEAAGLAQRCEFVAGDIFGSAPDGGDLYVLSRVLHNWDDDSARAILARCRQSMAETSTLLLVEVALPERAIDNPAAIRMDLPMLAVLGGRERTAADYGRLLEATGLGIKRVIPTHSPAGIAVIEAAPAGAVG